MTHPTPVTRARIESAIAAAGIRREDARLLADAAFEALVQVDGTAPAVDVFDDVHEAIADARFAVRGRLHPRFESDLLWDATDRVVGVFLN